eukprot:TRINITY_DN25348_c0_g1_i1.p1 TRINITY_DN25348_c0_g1~~TRINITY_DN25348_c0_g1_i1.p1  ORF type:complete len:223 (-),score=62.15 TRINITY_DN25348_c0_g1_i1:299-967(-)
MCIRDSLQADLSDELRVVRGELENSEKLRGDTEKAMECAQVEQAQLVQSLESALREAQEEHRQARAENAQLLEQSRRFQIQLQSAQEEATRFAAERSMARGSPSQMDGSDSLSMSSSSPVQLHACLPQPSPSPTSIDPEVVGKQAEPAHESAKQAELAHESDMFRMLRESHQSLIQTNQFLLREVDMLRAQHTQDALQWQKNYAALRAHNELVATAGKHDIP